VLAQPGAERDSGWNFPVIVQFPRAAELAEPTSGAPACCCFPLSKGSLLPSPSNRVSSRNSGVRTVLSPWSLHVSGLGFKYVQK
jgi:hypothetical protein